MRQPLMFAVLLFVSSQTRAQDRSWHYRKDDPVTKKHIVQIDAESFQQTKDGDAKFMLRGMTARLYDAVGSSYKQISSKQAIVDEKLGTLTYGPGLKTTIVLPN